jgi:hypothetical protein
VGDKGFYFEPTIFEVYDNKAKIAQEEIFGPVQCIFKWTDLNEVSHPMSHDDQWWPVTCAGTTYLYRLIRSYLYCCQK